LLYHTRTTVIYTLSLHDALPIYVRLAVEPQVRPVGVQDRDRIEACRTGALEEADRQHHAELARHRREMPHRPALGCRARETQVRSEEHTSELQSRGHLVCRLLLE